MYPTEWIKTHHKDYTDRNVLIKNCLEQTGAKRENVVSSLNRLKRIGIVSLNNVDKIKSLNATSSGITEDQLRKKHDISYIVQVNLKKLPEGSFYTEAEFIQKCSLRGQSGYRPILDHPDISAYKGRASGTIYYGHPKGIEKMKSEGVLS